MLITVWILGAVMVSLCGALFTMTRTADVERRNALVDVEVRHYIEALRATPYVPCAIATTYTPTNVGYTKDANVSASVTNVTLWEQKADHDGTINPTVALDTTPGGFDSTPAILHTHTAGAQPPTSFATRDRCDALSGAQTDDGIQHITLQVSDNEVPPVTVTADIIKRCDDADACQRWDQ